MHNKFILYYLYHKKELGFQKVKLDSNLWKYFILPGSVFLIFPARQYW